MKKDNMLGVADRFWLTIEIILLVLGTAGAAALIFVGPEYFLGKNDPEVLHYLLILACFAPFGLAKLFRIWIVWLAGYKDASIPNPRKANSDPDNSSRKR